MKKNYKYIKYKQKILDQQVLDCQYIFFKSIVNNFDWQMQEDRKCKFKIIKLLNPTLYVPWKYPFGLAKQHIFVQFTYLVKKKKHNKIYQ